jgi:hypothetical protein
MEDAVYCIFPNCNLKILSPQFAVVNPNYEVYGVCTRCEAHICAEHFGYKIANQSHNFRDESDLKNADFYLNSEEAYLPETDKDDEEPHDKAEVFCNYCNERTVFRIPFRDRTLMRQCKRCTEHYQQYAPSGCQRHTGEHEQVRDKKNEIISRNKLVDLGYDIYKITPIMYPSRWSCCGALCHHDHPGCPYYKKNEYHDSFVPHIEENSDYLGCEEATHTDMSDQTELQPLDWIKGIDIECKVLNGEPDGFTWEKLIHGQWRVGVPDHYPSGECPDSVKQLDHAYD